MKEEDGTEAKEGSKHNIILFRFFVVTAGQSVSRQKCLLREISIWKKGVAARARYVVKVSFLEPLCLAGCELQVRD